MIKSSDFADGVLDPVWTIEGPAGVSSSFGGNETDAFLTLHTPDGDHDIWGANNSVRAMQDAANEDFQVETRFLSTPTEKFQIQGLLVEADADNWIRFDTYSNGNRYKIFAATTVNGVSNTQFNITIPAGSAPYLRVTRVSDDWMLEHSSDGAVWTLAGTFSHTLDVTSVGVFSGNTGSSAGYTALVDYFESSSDPIEGEDGDFTPINQAPIAENDGLTTPVDTGVDIDILADLLANDSDPEGAQLSVTGFTQPANGTLTDNGDGTLTYTPAGGFEGDDSFTYTISDGEDEDTATVKITVTNDDPIVIQSDDFSGGTLDSVWSFEGPAGVSVSLGSSATDAYLALTTPDGDYDVYGTNNGARIMQAAADEDFQLETHFLSTPTEKFQIQGLLVEQDDNNWIRFDTYSRTNLYKIFAAVTIDGVSTTKFNVTLPAGSAQYLRVTRDGDNWSLEYSADGVSWALAGGFSHEMSVASVGVFTGNKGSSNGFTALVDYFENTAAPIVDEDGSYVPVNDAPIANDDVLFAPADSALTINVGSDLLANDTDANGDVITLTEFTQPSNGVLTDNGDGTLTYTPAGGFEGDDSFIYTISDGEYSETATVDITVAVVTEPEPVEIVSDDFSSETLDPVWIIDGPAGATVSLGTNATDAYLVLDTPDGNFDVWGTNNGVRAMQVASDDDFQLETRFLSTPTQKFEIQGLLVEEDANNWIRFDTYSRIDLYKIHAAVTVDGVSKTKFNITLPDASAPYLRVTRAGDVWTLEYSSNGTDWATAGSFTHEMSVSAVGVFSGNTGQSDGFTALVDYFENTASPIVSEDDSFAPVNDAPVANDDTLVASVDADLTIDVDVDLLGNDTDANGDVITVTEFTQPSSGVLTDNGDGTLTYTPTSGYQGSDSFTYTISDGEHSATATVDISVVAEPEHIEIKSDDFSGETLDPVWSIEGPAGVTSSVGTNATDAYLALTTPDGNFDVYGANNGVRAMQAAADEDFQLETRFLSTPTQQYQIQGILVEESANNWIRFDTYYTGSQYRVFAASTTNGTSSVEINVTLPSGNAPYLRVTRADDTWTLEHSYDGISWAISGSFVHEMSVTAVGVFSGNTGPATGYTALVDYFENTANPLVSEDGDFVPANEAPIAGDDVFDTETDTSVDITINTELLDNDSDANGDALTLTEFTQPANGTLLDNGDGTLTYTPNSGFEGDDTFTYTVSDGELTDTATVTIAVSPPPAQAVSDDFSGGALGDEWTFYGADGFAQVATTTTEAFAEIHSPYGAVVSASDHLTTPRLMQDVANTDFQISAGFLTVPSDKYQEHGLLVVQDDENFIRFDLAFTGNTLTLIVGIIKNGQTNYAVFESIAAGLVTDFQITRSGNDWVFEYSNDGETWVEAYTTSHTMVVGQVGAFAGSASFTGPAPGYVAQLDYFENAADPIIDEDGDITPVNVAPDAVDEAMATLIDEPIIIDIDDDLLANDTDGNGDVLSLDGFIQPTNGTLLDNGDGTLTYTPNAGFEGVDTFTYTVTDGDLTDTATVTMNVGHPINVWYGTEQEFASEGEAQVWINVLGNVVGDVASLTYSLNGGAARTLSVGEDTRRLHNEGDFNIDLAYAELDGSATDDVITITSTLTNGDIYTQDVTIVYESGHDWAPNYSIDWDTVTNIQDVVQITDGTWALDGDGVRPVDLGYDRLLVLGDQGWDNYELNLTIDINDLDNTDPRGRDGGAFAFGMLFNGHTDAPVANLQPKSGWEPGAAFFLTKNDLTSHSYHRFADVLDNGSHALQEGLTYNFKLRVEQTGIYDRVYSLKFWEVGTVEPAGWNSQGIETFAIDEAPATGSIYLNAHYFDVTFNDLSVTEISGNDILQGTDGDDILIGADSGQALPGAGEVDVMVSNGGADTFVFGDETTVFYDDGNTGDAGEADYGFIWDFDAATGTIQLHGSASDYYLAATTAGMPDGTAIYLTKDGAEPDELIAIINATTGLDLNSDTFLFVDSGSIA